MVSLPVDFHTRTNSAGRLFCSIVTAFVRIAVCDHPVQPTIKIEDSMLEIFVSHNQIIMVLIHNQVLALELPPMNARICGLKLFAQYSRVHVNLQGNAWFCILFGSWGYFVSNGMTKRGVEFLQGEVLAESFWLPMSALHFVEEILLIEIHRNRKNDFRGFEPIFSRLISIQLHPTSIHFQMENFHVSQNFHFTC